MYVVMFSIYGFAKINNARLNMASFAYFEGHCSLSSDSCIAKSVGYSTYVN